MELSPSQLNKDDYPQGPTGLARFIEDRMVELEEAKAKSRTKAKLRPINKHLHTLREMLKWCKTRAGYQPTPKE